MDSPLERLKFMLNPFGGGPAALEQRDKADAAAANSDLPAAQQMAQMGIGRQAEPQQDPAAAQEQMLQQALQQYQQNPDMQNMSASYSGPSKGYQAAQADYMKSLAESQGLQKEGIGALQKRIADLQNAPKRNDGLQQAIIAAADLWGGGGGKFDQMYKENNPNMSPAQRQAAITQLEDTLRKSRGDLSDSQVAALKARLGFEEEKMKLAAKPGEKPSTEQYKAAEFASRMSGSDSALDKLFTKGFKPSRLGDWSPKELQSEDQKNYDNYTRTFINAVLRRESGAAISKDEMTNAKEQYIPVIGDSPSMINEKSLLRKQALQNLGTSAGPAMKLMQGLNIGPQSGGQASSATGSPWKRYGGT